MKTIFSWACQLYVSKCLWTGHTPPQCRDVLEQRLVHLQHCLLCSRETQPALKVIQCHQPVRAEPSQSLQSSLRIRFSERAGQIGAGHVEIGGLAAGALQQMGLARARPTVEPQTNELIIGDTTLQAMHYLGIRSGHKGRQRLDGSNGKVEQQLGVRDTHASSFES